MPTPHNTANKGDIAKTVIMPGDPLRAKFIADTFLLDAKCFNTVRNMFGYTGTYNGKTVSVMAHGMGIPSIGIYSYELFKFYAVENIIRVGSAGALDPSLNILDVCLASSSFSESTYAHVMSGYNKQITYPSLGLNEKIRSSAQKLGISLHEGTFYSSDVFYVEESKTKNKEVADNNCIVTEMESFGLFHNAAVLGKNAATLCTVSDIIGSSKPNQKDLSPEERQTGFKNMIKIALEAI